MNYAKRLVRGMRHGEKGFTLIELLIVIAILGVIAAVVVLNIGGFMGAGELEAANVEAHQVQTAVMGYMAAEHLVTYAGTVGPTGGAVCDPYLQGGEAKLKADYTVDTAAAGGCIITGATAAADGWSAAIAWGGDTECQWVEAASP